VNEEIARKQLIDYINLKIELNQEEQEKVANAYNLRQVKKKDFFLKEGTQCIYQGFVVG
jgi:hypothetical protein